MFVYIYIYMYVYIHTYIDIYTLTSLTPSSSFFFSFIFFSHVWLLYMCPVFQSSKWSSFIFKIPLKILSGKSQLKET